MEPRYCPNCGSRDTKWEQTQALLVDEDQRDDSTGILQNPVWRGRCECNWVGLVEYDHR